LFHILTISKNAKIGNDKKIINKKWTVSYATLSSLKGAKIYYVTNI